MGEGWGGGGKLARFAGAKKEWPYPPFTATVSRVFTRTIEEIRISLEHEESFGE
jgi:hypothetical protein